MNELRDYYQNVYSNQDSDLGEEFCSDFLDNSYNQWKFPAILVFFPTSVFDLQNMADFHIFYCILLIANQIMVPFFNNCKKHPFGRKRYVLSSF